MFKSVGMRSLVAFALLAVACEVCAHSLLDIRKKEQTVNLNCQKVKDGTEPDPCNNGGTCELLEWSGKIFDYCKCPQDVFGKFCDRKCSVADIARCDNNCDASEYCGPDAAPQLCCSCQKECDNNPEKTIKWSGVNCDSPPEYLLQRHCGAKKREFEEALEDLLESLDDK